MSKMNTLGIMHISIPIPNNPAAAYSLAFAGGSPTPRRLAAAGRQRCCSLQCTSKTISQLPSARRRSANYKPPFWDFNYIQSLSSEYNEERYVIRVSELFLQVKMLLKQEMEGVRRLELIDDLQRLGLSRYFHDEINQILNLELGNYENNGRDLYLTALSFRLLRQHGFRISQEVFDCFKNEKGDFRADLVDDIRGVLQLYEASFLLREGEATLEVAKEFATNCLQRKLDEEDGNGGTDDNLLALVRHALELPIHWRIQRPNARWFIDAYEKREKPQKNPVVLELAKLDFNMIQAMHQKELKLISKWWKQTRLIETLPFARDRVVECFLWTLSLFPPENGYARMMITKTNVFITIIDDIFDVYGTLEELHLFNSFVQRWDVEAVNQLPEYMQICFMALNNFVNEMAYDVLQEKGVLIVPHLRRSWRDLCGSFMQEARWHAEGHTPTLDEYISNGLISSSVPTILSHAFFLIANPVDNEASLYKYHDIVQFPAMVLRLKNDLATSLNEIERGDVAGPVECYVKETGASREEAREHVKLMICETWKKMNEERVRDSEFSREFIASAVDLARMAQYMYQLGDGHGVQNPQIKDRISSLVFESI